VNINHILFPVDFSGAKSHTQLGRRVVSVAFQLATEFGARVHLHHTLPEIERGPYRYLDTAFPRQLMHLKEEQIASLQKEAGTEFPLAIAEKQIARNIADGALADGGRPDCDRTWEIPDDLGQPSNARLRDYS
jgi:hypothetical protein